MNKLSSSPERYTFQRDCYIKARQENGIADPEEYQQMLDYYGSLQETKSKKEQDPVWQKDNLEYDLRTTDWILEKVRSSTTYAQNLYAAMCNNEFMKLDVMPILKEQTWSCSWRYAGGIVADMRGEGDYIEWYCSGSGSFADDNTYGFQPESAVTDEIREDLLKLGWVVLDDNN